jgi:hypothetical protein
MTEGNIVGSTAFKNYLSNLPSEAFSVVGEELRKDMADKAEKDREQREGPFDWLKKFLKWAFDNLLRMIQNISNFMSMKWGNSMPSEESMGKGSAAFGNFFNADSKGESQTEGGAKANYEAKLKEIDELEKSGKLTGEKATLFRQMAKQYLDNITGVVKQGKDANSEESIQAGIDSFNALKAPMDEGDLSAGETNLKGRLGIARDMGGRILNAGRVNDQRIQAFSETTPIPVTAPPAPETPKAPITPTTPDTTSTSDNKKIPGASGVVTNNNTVYNNVDASTHPDAAAKGLNKAPHESQP